MTFLRKLIRFIQLDFTTKVSKLNLVFKKEFEMPVEVGELIEVISVIANEQNVRVTMEESGKGALICAASALIGGLLLGPRGLALGGAVGGAAAYAASGNFRSLGEVLLNDLSDRQQQMLAQRIKNAVASIGLSDLAMLLPLIMEDKSVQEMVLKTTMNFVTRELNIRMID